jgi:subtilisin family serine protease
VARTVRSSLALLLGACLVTSLQVVPAGAAPAGTTGRSTQVPMPAPDGRLSSYVVNAARPWGASTALVERAVRRNGGTLVQSWPEIGVVVAHSRESGFRKAMRRRDVVASVGMTRTTRVKEGTPGTARPSAETGGLPDKQEFRPATRAQAVADPREARQWDMKVIRADEAHEISDGSADVLVGILDSGIEHDHPDLVDNIDTTASVNCTDAGSVDTSTRGWRPTSSDHGTHVAGTVAAARNGTGIVGVAPDARMASVKVVNDDGYIYPEYAICGFMWAGLQGMDVTNNSYYVDPFMYWCDDRPDQAAAMAAVARAVRWSTGQGVTHVAAAGNASTDLDRNTRDRSSPNDSRAVSRRINSGCKDLPTELPGVITVSSFARIKQTLRTKASFFSNVGLRAIDVAAPGSNILSTTWDGRYVRYSGTSMASPHVAGVVALLLSAQPDLTPTQVREAIRAMAKDKPCRAAQYDALPTCRGTDERNSYAGEGMVDALRALTP